MLFNARHISVSIQSLSNNKVFFVFFFFETAFFLFLKKKMQELLGGENHFKIFFKHCVKKIVRAP